MTLEQNEKLAVTETSPASHAIEESGDATLTAEAVSNLFLERHNHLQTIKAWVGLKFYYRAAEKVKQEEASLKRLLRLEDVKQTVLSDYSFVLDQAYFEQKFLTPL